MAVSAAAAEVPACPFRMSEDGIIRNPADLTSAGGLLKAAFTLVSERMHEQNLRECYVYESAAGAAEAPTLRLNPGDRLELTLTNRLTYVPLPLRAIAGFVPHDMAGMLPRAIPGDPCSGGAMAATSTNIHFHGLSIPPKCHQDDVLITSIENTDAPFEYKFQIPPGAPPGMYWYHPHLHGFSTLQVNGGAAGVLIVGGIEKVKPEVDGLPERVLIIRQEFKDPNSWLPGPNLLTLNFQPALYPRRRSPIIQMKPGAREFWRVANAASQAFLALQVVFGNTPQKMRLVALDGVPVRRSVDLTTITVPPAGRAEFIVKAPAAGQAARFQQAGFDAGAIGPINPPQELAKIEAPQEAAAPPPLVASPANSRAYVHPPPGTVTARRRLYFAEAANGTNGPTAFFLTVEGQTPKPFDAAAPPAIVTKVGALEDWTIANHAGEVHTFHIHQIHFLFLEVNGKKLPHPESRDTVILPAWNGAGPYPTVKLRMDFRDPNIAGTFVFHCHILDHEDAGMMAKMRVDPN